MRLKQTFLQPLTIRVYQQARPEMLHQLPVAGESERLDLACPSRNGRETKSSKTDEENGRVYPLNLEAPCGERGYLLSDAGSTLRDNAASRHTRRRRSDRAGRRCRSARDLTVRQTLDVYCDCRRGRRESPGCRRQHFRCAVAVVTNGLELQSLGRVEICRIRTDRNRN